MAIRTIEKWTKIGLGHVGINFEQKIEWAEIGFSRQAHHVEMNSFKHFSGPKKGLPCRTPIFIQNFQGFFHEIEAFLSWRKGIPTKT